VISCQDADVLAAALSVGSIDGADHAALQSHVGSCADCRRVASEYMAAAARLPLALEPLQPSPELRTRLMKAVYAEAAADARPQAWWRRAWTRVPVGRGFTALAAAAAVAVLALSTWGLVRGQNPLPVTRTVALTIMPAAHAHGQLVYDRGGSQAVLTVTGLPGPATAAGRAGAVYEVWLIPSSGAPVPAAFLNQGPDGTWTAALHADMSSYAMVAATIEPLGGSRAPTGIEVLHASLTGA
jgi:anti-sigma-K factor RskA